MGSSGRSPSGFHRVKTRYLQVIRSALGRTRTCDLLIRSLKRHVYGRPPISQGLLVAGYRLTLFGLRLAVLPARTCLLEGYDGSSLLFARLLCQGSETLSGSHYCLLA